MKIRKRHIILGIIFLLNLVIRLYISYQFPNYSSSESYFHLRQINSITENGLPIINDDLSNNGRTNLFLPLFHYISAPLFLLFGHKGMTFLMNLLASLLPIVVYILATQLIKKKRICVLSAIMVSFLPILTTETLNNVNTHGLMLILTLAYIILFIRFLKEDKVLTYLLFSLVALILTTHISIALLAGFVMYFLFKYVEKIKIEKKELEMTFFGLFLALWTYFILFKKAFILYGAGIIWQNVPEQILGAYYNRIGILEIVPSIGLIPLIFGVYGVYLYLFKRKNQYVYTVLGLLSCTFLFSWFRLIPIFPALMIIGICLIIMSLLALQDFMLFIKKTKWSQYENHIYFALIALIIITQLPFMNIEAPYTENEVDAFRWLNENAHPSATILGTVDEGTLITYFAEKRNVIDTNYLLVQNTDIIVEDVETIYRTSYVVDAGLLLDKYDIDFIVFSERAKNQFNITEIQYINGDCFDLIYNETSKIYRFLCRVRT